MDEPDFFQKSAELAGHTVKPAEQSPLALAHLGDAVFELLVRSHAIGEGRVPVGVLAKKSIKYVNAAAQSEFYNKIQDNLTDAELAVMKRGRNAKSTSRAKNASVADYRRATGVEALFGWLFLRGENARIMELFSLIDFIE